MRVEFDFNKGQLEQILLEGISEVVRNTLREIKPAMQARIYEQIDRLIKESPEYEALLLTENFRGEIGIAESVGVNPASFMDDMIKALQAGVIVDVRPVQVSRGEVIGEIYVGVVKLGFEELLSLGGASFISINQKTKTANTVPWLKWLLTAGTATVIETHYFIAGKKGRTGAGVMGLTKIGKGWNVPQTFGPTTPEDNWIIRALTPLADTIIGEIFEEELAK